jgi:hypothetical protein
VLFAVFVLRESRTREPLLPLGLFRSVPLSVGVVLMMQMAFGMFGGMFFLTFYLQSVHLLSPVALLSLLVRAGRQVEAAA